MNNAEAVRAPLIRDLPLGTPVADVLAYLDAAKVDNSGLLREEAMIGAIWRDVARNDLVSQSVRAAFRFDAAGKLASITAKGLFTGP